MRPDIYIVNGCTNDTQANRRNVPLSPSHIFDLILKYTV